MVRYTKRIFRKKVFFILEGGRLEKKCFDKNDVADIDVCKSKCDKGVMDINRRLWNVHRGL